MYERSAIVLERYFENLFNFNKENNLKENYKKYSSMVEQLKEYQQITEEEEMIIQKFDEVAGKIEEIQKKETKLYESNIELENQRNKLFQDLSESPNSLDIKIQKIENKLNENNEELSNLREKYIKLLEIFTERQKERNKFTRTKRTVETKYIDNIKNAKESFEKIDKKDAIALKKFITIDKEPYVQTIINIMLENGKTERLPFNKNVIEKAVVERMDIAEKEAEIYINVYEKTKKLIDEIEGDNIKLARAEKVLRDTSVKLNFLEAKKEYIVAFLDNERMTAISGKKAHEKLMKEACENFDADIEQINNLYELVVRETAGKSTKKAYNELYNKTYLKDIREKEKKFEIETTGVKINAGTIINFNYWRIDGIKNVYNTFQDEITEKFDKDLSELKIEEPEEQASEADEIYNIPTNDEEEYEYDEDITYENDDEEEYQFENDDDDENYEYEDDEEYEYEDDDDEDEDDDEYDYEDDNDDEEYNNEQDGNDEDEEEYEDNDDDDDIEYEDDENDEIEYEDDEDEFDGEEKNDEKEISQGIFKKLFKKKQKEA